MKYSFDKEQKQSGWPGWAHIHQWFAMEIVRHPGVSLVALLLALVAVGTVGFMIIEGWRPLDALYMTIITLTTIGFGETQPLSPTGRVFTIVFIIVGVVVASYAVSAFIELFTSDRFMIDLRNRRRRRILQQLNNHCIICGFGRMGASLANELGGRHSPVVAIDIDPEAIEYCREMGIPALEGSAADDQILREAGIERASSLVAATKSDAENVFIILTAKSINEEIKVISRCNSNASVAKLEKAGADTVISPYSIAGKRIAHMLTHPNVTNFLDGVLDFGDHKMRLEEFIISPESSLAGLTLREAKLKVAVLAVDHPEKAVFAHPHADTRLLPGAAIIVMGVDRELINLEQLAHGSRN